MVSEPLLTLVINLDKRFERFNQLSELLSTNGANVHRIRALTPATLGYSDVEEFGTTPSVVSACWESHKRALATFLESNEDICLIIEDDANFTQNGLALLKHKEDLLRMNFDLFQIGFVLSRGKLDLGESYLRNKVLSIFKIFAIRKLRLPLRIYGKIFYKQEFKRSSSFISNFMRGLPFHNHVLRLLSQADNVISRVNSVKFLGKRNYIQQGNFQAGAHAYLVNRATAKFLISINSPCFLATDLLYIALARAENLKFVRVTSSLVNQNENLASDINQRSRLYG